ncbi:TonB-linked outer membrane protein, SusC/RagA family [Chryseobacterium polytrichastri]|uniref:TonB-linked outer membrane protein, SusC/RagA family n=2 Tax=Chryseobacterium polytrichastri TaxID=1302687 RepID=A0A1M7DM69_9FLAO|nr:TonB-linked outer membrane protein, SusC/RagA family [Chryseobacterium polytrichastri]
MNFYTCFPNALRHYRKAIPRTIRGMKLVSLIIAMTCLKVSAALYAQRISLTVKQQPLATVFTIIEKQTGYQFWYKSKDVQNAARVTLNLSNVELRPALDRIFENQALTYEMVNKTIVVKAIERSTIRKIGDYLNQQNKQTISGMVTDDHDEPLAGATIRVKGSEKTTTTNKEGKYGLTDIADDAVLIVSYMGYSTQEIRAKNAERIILSKSESKLDEVQIIAYGTTTKRLNTGSVGGISGADIAKQPVSNPLAALSGRIPGLVVTQSSGVPGSSFNIQIRGRNSIAQGSQPLILIDGIPFAAGNEGISSLPSALTNGVTGTSLSPFNSINPSDIESIEILKDADATAIYGSRGANGVVLITTRKGTAGKTQVSVNINQGFTEVGKTMDLMNTQQYLEMRKEAFMNSNTTPTVFNAPDLTAWDQNRYTNYKKELIGGTGKLTNAQLSISGGSSEIQYLIGGSFYRETSVFPNALPNIRGSVNMNLNHISKDRRFNMTFSGSFTAGENKTAGTDLTYYTFLSPNTPDFFTPEGKLKWMENGSQYENPYRYLFETYNATTHNLVSSLNTSYKIFDGLTLKLAMGYNRLNGKEIKLTPKSSLSPDQIPISSSQFSVNAYSSWNIEPQIQYVRPLGPGKLDVLAGATFHQKNTSGNYILVSGFTTDALMESIGAASTINAASNSETQYKYQAVFARINYNVNNKYIVNLTARRDGSSRFGTGRQFANFGAVGAAWVFTEEKWLKDQLSFLSFGKLRGSYGITGNDQIGDYQFLDSWQAGSQTYQGTGTLRPSALANPNYTWEENKKLEGAIDLGFFRDRFLFSANYYRNRSSNQLVAYRLPYLTGFASIIRNFPAVVQNQGWEFSLSADIFRDRPFKWSVSLNATLPRNSLLAFPGIENSSYASLYKVGSSLNSLYNYHYTDIDPATGLYRFTDVDGNGSYTAGDLVINGTLDPKIYGGLNNTFGYKGFELSVFFDYKKQTGKNFLYSVYNLSMVPGMMLNQPSVVTDRWQNANSISQYEKYTVVAGSTVPNVAYSDRVYSDMSFIRLRNVSLSYSLPKALISRLSLGSAKIYMQGQNLFTWSKMQGFDPETQSLYSLPPLKVYTIGLQLNL